VIDALLPDLAGRLADDTVAAGDWIAGARLVHLGSKWEGRAAFVLFAPSDPHPRVVVKVDRTRRGRRRLRREHDALCAIAGVPRLTGTVPRSLALFERAGTLVLAQTALDGRTLAVDLRRRLRPTLRRVRADHDAVLTWLRDLQGPLDAHARRPVEADETVAMAEQVLPRDEAWAARTIAWLTASAARIGTIEIPLVRGHGDLGPSNIMVAPGGVGVVDWEGAAAQAPALNDVLMFLHHYARATPAPRGGLLDRHDIVTTVFLGDGLLGRETWRRWCAALERAGLPVEAARYMLFLHLVQFATNATEFAHRDRVSPMWSEITRRYARQWARHGFPEGAAGGR
jgi:hypothetical protein